MYLKRCELSGRWLYETQRKQRLMNKKVFTRWPSLLDGLKTAKEKNITIPVGIGSHHCWALRRQWRRALDWEDERIAIVCRDFLGITLQGRDVQGIYTPVLGAWTLRTGSVSSNHHRRDGIPGTPEPPWRNALSNETIIYTTPALIIREIFSLPSWISSHACNFDWRIKEQRWGLRMPVSVGARKGAFPGEQQQSHQMPLTKSVETTTQAGIPVEITQSI